MRVDSTQLGNDSVRFQKFPNAVNAVKHLDKENLLAYLFLISHEVNFFIYLKTIHVISIVRIPRFWLQNFYVFRFCNWSEMEDDNSLA